ncbi:MAG TPA: hypothetical protein DCY88_20960 [Cyanobacteria bacterium UBA11372]|nr:hypothetical protein [Cyanobacteria bacterium UBA11372]
MTSRTARRKRGQILTETGLEKIKEAIAKAFPNGYTLPDISARTERTHSADNPKSSNFVSNDTISHILNRRAGADKSKLESLFRAFGLNLEPDDHKAAADHFGHQAANSNQRQDWGEAPDVSVFYGRTEELAKLEQWILTDRCRLVLLWGMAGIGKRFLSVKLAQQITDKFEYTIWRSLRHAPPIQDILTDLIEFFSDEQETDLPTTVASGISRLIKCLQTNRCLVVLDGVETVQERRYPERYQEYEMLFRQVGESEHRSCLVLTSSEKPREIDLLESRTGPVRSYKIQGLTLDAAREILREVGLVDENEWDSIIEHYRSNPLYLKIVSACIVKIFAGKASNFIEKNTTFLGRIEKVLEQQFEQIHNLEIKVMRQLAIARDSLGIDQLRSEISPPISTSKLMEALDSLLCLSLIEKITEGDEDLFTLQPVVRKYVINRFGQI